MRGTERVHQEFPLRFKLLLIVTRTGRDYRPGPHLRIEQVATVGAAYTGVQLYPSLTVLGEVTVTNDADKKTAVAFTHFRRHQVTVRT